MKYTVVWKPSAETALAEIWLSDSDRAAVTDASNAIENLISSSPLDAGESREAGSRFLAVLPLCVYYEVLEDDRRVEVFAVWRVFNRQK